MCRIIELIGGTCTGKTTFVKQLKQHVQGKKNVCTHFEFILRVLKMPYNRFTFLWVLHPFLYMQYFFCACHYKRLFIDFFSAILRKPKPYPFLTKFKLCNNWIRSLGALYFLKKRIGKDKNILILIDEGITQMINNIIITFGSYIDLSLWDQLFPQIPSGLRTEVCLFEETEENIVERCLSRPDPSFGRKKLTKKQWAFFAQNSKKSFSYFIDKTKESLHILPRNNRIEYFCKNILKENKECSVL